MLAAFQAIDSGNTAPPSLRLSARHVLSQTLRNGVLARAAPRTSRAFCTSLRAGGCATREAIGAFAFLPCRGHIDIASIESRVPYCNSQGAQASARDRAGMPNRKSRGYPFAVVMEATDGDGNPLEFGLYDMVASA